MEQLIIQIVRLLPYAGSLLGIILLYKALVYIRDRNWTLPTLKEFLSPVSRDIEFLKFLEIAHGHGWSIENDKNFRDDHFSIFHKKLTEASISGALKFSGREDVGSNILNDLEPHKPIEKDFWKDNQINLFSYQDTDNKKTQTNPSAQHYLEKDQIGQKCIEYYDLYLNERSARKWLTETSTNKPK